MIQMINFYKSCCTRNVLIIGCWCFTWQGSIKRHGPDARIIASLEKIREDTCYQNEQETDQLAIYKRS